MLLRVENLQVSFGRTGVARPAVDGVSLQIGTGQTFGLVGESGCGKSTLGRAILRLLPQARGCVLFQGRNLLALRERELRPLRRGLQMVFQNAGASLHPRMTAAALVTEPLLIHGLAPRRELRDRAQDLLSRVGLATVDLDRRPGELSGGQRQRLAIARALASAPQLLICDEPVSALDASVGGQILNLLAELRQAQGLACLLIGHDVEMVGASSDVLSVMFAGRIVESGPAAEVYAHPAHPYTRALRAAVLPALIPPGGSPAPRLVRLIGSLPAAAGRGCAYHPRCPWADERCRREVPPLAAVSSGAQPRQVACHHWERLPGENVSAPRDG